MGFTKARGRTAAAKRTVSHKSVPAKTVSSKTTVSRSASNKSISSTTASSKPVNGRTVRSNHAACKPKPKKWVCRKFKKRSSAFRAVSGANQTLLIGSFQKVQYQVEELDLNNEYNSATSTFRPKQRGVYALVASASVTTITLTDYQMELEIRVNNVARISEIEDFTPRLGIITATGIVPLQAGDRVEVFARVTGENVEILSGLATHFEGAKIR